MTEHKCNSCFYMQHERDKHPCNVCDNYNKYVNRNVYINSNIPAERKFEECLSPDFKPLTQAVKTWDFDDAFDGYYGGSEDYVQKANDAVHSPRHYTSGKFEVIDVIEDWGLNFRLANTVKYIARHKHKGKPLEDLKKALWYLQREIDRHESHS